MVAQNQDLKWYTCVSDLQLVYTTSGTWTRLRQPANFFLHVGSFSYPLNSRPYSARAHIHLRTLKQHYILWYQRSNFKVVVSDPTQLESDHITDQGNFNSKPYHHQNNHVFLRKYSPHSATTSPKRHIILTALAATELSSERGEEELSFQPVIISLQLQATRATARQARRAQPPSILSIQHKQQQQRGGGGTQRRG